MKTRPYILALFLIIIAFPTESHANNKYITTILKGTVSQIPDNATVRGAKVSLLVGDVEYTALTGSNGRYQIEDIVLSNLILNKGVLTVRVNEVVIKKKNNFLLGVKENKSDLVIEGNVRVPRTPDLDLMYTYTNDKLEKFKGQKDAYSSVYINGTEVAPPTSSRKWKGSFELKRGLNTLVIKSKNICGIESKPLVFHITYFYSSEGTVEFFDGPENVRAKREEANSVVSWDLIDEGSVAGYNIYRTNVSGRSYGKINSEPVSGNSYTDIGIPAGDYFYTVTAVREGYESGFSLETTAAENFLGGTGLPDRITKDTILTREGGPYLVSSAVVIENGASLIIEPGVEVRFMAGQASLSGNIIADASGGEPIIFTSARKRASPGDWKGLDLNGESVLNNCKIEYAGRDKTDAVSLRGESVLKNSSVTSNAHNGVGIKTEGRDTKVLVSGNNISKNEKNGILVSDSKSHKDQSVKNSSVIIGNEIRGNSAGGIFTGSQRGE